MNKAVLISIRPKWCEKIASGDKTIEVRKTRPKLQTPFKCYIYCTQSGVALGAWGKHGKVIGEFTCDRIVDAWWDYAPDAITREVTGGNLEELDGIGMTDEELFAYVGDRLSGHCYGWHISDLRIYDAPRELSEFWFPTERYCEKELCGGCPCDQVADVNGEYEFDCEWRRPLNRPPQSWCYVEEMT